MWMGKHNLYKKIFNFKSIIVFFFFLLPVIGFKNILLENNSLIVEETFVTPKADICDPYDQGTSTSLPVDDIDNNSQEAVCAFQVGVNNSQYYFNAAQSNYSTFDKIYVNFNEERYTEVAIASVELLLFNPQLDKTDADYYQSIEVSETIATDAGEIWRFNVTKYQDFFAYGLRVNYYNNLLPEEIDNVEYYFENPNLDPDLNINNLDENFLEGLNGNVFLTSNHEQMPKFDFEKQYSYEIFPNYLVLTVPIINPLNIPPNIRYSYNNYFLSGNTNRLSYSQDLVEFQITSVNSSFPVNDFYIAIGSGNKILYLPSIYPNTDDADYTQFESHYTNIVELKENSITVSFELTAKVEDDITFSYSLEKDEFNNREWTSLEASQVEKNNNTYTITINNLNPDQDYELVAIRVDKNETTIKIPEFRTPILESENNQENEYQKNGYLSNGSIIAICISSFVFVGLIIFAYFYYQNMKIKKIEAQNPQQPEKSISEQLEEKRKDK